VLAVTLLSAAFLGSCGGSSGDSEPAAGRAEPAGNTGEAASAAAMISDTEDLEQCFTDAGAKIANGTADLDFARADVRNRNLEIEAQGLAIFDIATIEVKPSRPQAGDYRIFTAYRKNETSKLTPFTAIQEHVFTVYFPPPPKKAAVTAAEDCMDGEIGS
jgi:hypothetical protein